VTLPPDAQGRLVLDLTEPTGAKVALEAIEAPAVPAVASARPPLTNFTPQRTAEGSIGRAFANRFGAHDPIYVIYGNERLAAKFQFSFKYRILGEDASLGDKLPALNRLYFGYTQRSLWDTDADSSPFYDTSYLPELMFESQKVLDPDSPGGFKWVGYQVGVRHESNGQSGATSRSVNTVYVRPGFAFGRFDGWHVIIAPRLSFYVSDLSNNPDIADYRGNVELQTIIGRGNGPALALTSRIGQESGKGSLQSDLTVPVKFDRLFDFATFVLVQYWDGYGESLLDYDQRSTGVRVGFSLVR
jgi:phospholipase A1